MKIKLRQVEVCCKIASFVDTANGWVYGIQYSFMGSHITAVLRSSELDVVIFLIESLTVEVSQAKMVIFFAAGR